MLKRLRIQFIALTMATIGIVLTLVSVAICTFDYQRSLSDVYRALETAVSPIHVEPDSKEPPQDDQSGDQADEERSGEEAADESDAPHPTIGGLDEADRNRVIPIAVYSVNEGGTIETIASRATASVDADVLESASEELSEADDGHGLLSAVGLYYAKRTYDVDGQAVERISFADEGSVSSWQKLAVLCAVVEAFALGVLFVVSLFLSKWALRPAERAWEQQTRFVADASHELKTPLTVILANASILADHPEKTVGSQMQWVESTATEAHRMQDLVADMLELASAGEPKSTRRIGATGLEEPAGALQERVDLSELVERCLLQFESVAFERGVELSGDVAPGIFVRGDAEKLGRLVSTLLENACKYSSADGTVTATLQPSSDVVRLSLHNDGEPIPAEDLPHVFDRFYRADKARTRGIGGYGLGLSIAQDIARAHGGSIAAKSSASSGTTFTVILPRA